MDKKGQITQGEVIDHVLANHLAFDLKPSEEVDHSRWISDHFPIACTLSLPSVVHPCWMLPKPMGIERKVDSPPESNAERPENFVAWNQRAVRWVSEAHGVKAVQRCVISSSFPEEKKLPMDHKYATALATQRTIAHARVSGLNRVLFRRLTRQG